ncbi:MAG: hypothetical protein ACI4PL_06775 [Faecousia sp.]
MYQGKFDSQNRKSQRSVYELIEERSARKAAKPAPKAPAKPSSPAGEPAQRQRPTAKESAMPGMDPIPARTAAPGKAAPARAAAPAKVPSPSRAAAPAKAPSSGRTAVLDAPQSAPLPPRKRTGTLVFYTVCMGFVFVFFLATFFGLKYLNAWLVRFESAQPTAKSAEAFEELFANPDWDALYDRAGMTIGKDSFRQVMEEKVGSQALSYAETSVGLAKNQKKYVVLLGDETIATFTLANRNPNQGDTEVPDWELDSVEFKLERKAPFRIRLRQGHTALVNGEPLGEEHTVIRESSRAKDYLPVTVAAPTYITLEVSDLLAQPEVVIRDETGLELPVSYDAASRTFSEAVSQPELPDDLRELAINAVKTYANYMNRKASAGDLAKYFDKDSNAYTSSTDLMGKEGQWVQMGSNYVFSDESVTDYQVYSNDIFSVRVSVTLIITRKEDGSTKESDITQTLFFSKGSSGKWSCFEMTAVDAAQLDKEVLLTFREDDTVLSSEFYDAGAAGINCPLVSAPEGKTFSGWMVEEQDEKGATVLRVVFQPDESGYVSLSGTTLEPMTLYPLFE